MSTQNNDLRKLKRRDLLELLLTQSKKVTQLQEEQEEERGKRVEAEATIERLKAKLDEKDAQIEHLKERLNAKDSQIAKLEEGLERPAPDGSEECATLDDVYATVIRALKDHDHGIG